MQFAWFPEVAELSQDFVAAQQGLRNHRSLGGRAGSELVSWSSLPLSLL